MSPATLSTLLAFAAATISLVSAQGPQGTLPATPLASKHFSYPSGIPYKVDTDTNLIRGPQHGYNICNSTTQNQQSLCQTSFLDSLDDFCLWAPPEPGKSVGDVESIMVAWCSKPGRGQRLIPESALQGVQFMRTPDYVQVVGFIDQAQINIPIADFGGEMDPHGADSRGNPMGGIVFSNAWGGSNDSFIQAIEWHNFMGSNTFCFKACDPSKTNARRYCEHIFDRIGCAYNAPNNAKNGTFESCLGDNQDFPGVYTDTDGSVKTYRQPPESLGPITTVTYTPKIPASSSCVQFQSSSLYAALASVTASQTGLGGPPKPTSSSSSGSRSASSSGTRSGSAAGPSNTSNDAEVLAASGLISLVGVVFSAMMFA